MLAALAFPPQSRAWGGEGEPMLRAGRCENVSSAVVVGDCGWSVWAVACARALHAPRDGDSSGDFCGGRVARAGLSDLA